jgi:NadR type nicotinamide-nucleotide adenylyltransferase
MYKKSLVFGKFMPLHKGHQALITYALGHSQQVVLSMSYTPQDPIDVAVRMNWLTVLYGQNPNITLACELDDFNDDQLPIEQATQLWADFIRVKFPDIEAIFCSETYGYYLQQHLGIPCKIFDLDRNKIPVSATKIRANPFGYWDYIPEVVRPYFVKKVCLFGPESVGKSTLSRYLAEYFQTNFVHEVARDLVSNNTFSVADIIKIGHAQQAALVQSAQTANKVLFCDTDLITTQIYSDYYLGQVPAVLYELEKTTTFDLYCLLNIDVPWVADGLRDLGHKRQEMYEVFRQALVLRNIPFIDVSGNWATRQQIVINAVNNWF